MDASQSAFFGEADLRRAARAGCFLLPTPASGTVTLHAGVLRYDPALPDAVRGVAVLKLLRAEGMSDRVRLQKKVG